MACFVPEGRFRIEMFNGLVKYLFPSLPVKKKKKEKKKADSFDVKSAVT